MPVSIYSDYLRQIAAIHRAIAAGDEPSAPSLARRFGTSARTVQRQIFFLRDELGAPLEWDGSRRCYYYTRRWDFAQALTRWLETEPAGAAK